MNLRKRRRRSQGKPAPKTGFKKRRLKNQIDFKDAAIKFLIVLFLFVDLVFVVFAVRQCTGQKKAPVSAAKENGIEEGKNEIDVPTPPAQQTKPAAVQIEVLNGCGVPGIADRFTTYLRRNQFDVVKTGNYEAYGVSKTVVIDRKGNLKAAERIAQTLGLPKERAIQQRSDAFPIDASVIIGSDFRQLSCWKKMEKERVRTGF